MELLQCRIKKETLRKTARKCRKCRKYSKLYGNEAGMTEKRWRIGLLVLLFVFICANGSTLFLRFYEPKIWEGIYVDTIPLGGLKKDEAIIRLQEYEEKVAGHTVLVSLGAVQTKKVNLQSIGFELNTATVVETILQKQKSVNLIRTYLEKRKLKQQPKQYDLEVTVREDLVREYLEQSAILFDVAPKEPILRREHGVFVYEDGKNGRKLSVDLTLLQFVKQLKEWTKQEDIVVTAISEKVEPVYSVEWLKQCDSLLAEYSTSYQVTEDVDEATVKGRIQNIKNGAGKLDGVVLMPNEVVSCYEVLQPFTGENGYDIAATYVQGRVVESMGGGVCQLSTTLYNACLFAELEVVERSAHSMTVGYIPLSRDAAIAGEDKDLKIKNNTDAPVYIEAKAEDGLVTFLVYGKAKKAGREVRLQTVVLETIQPGEDMIVKNSKFPASHVQVLQAAHTGYKTELYKIVYQNGMEIVRERVNTSEYAAVPRYVEVGGRE